MKEAVAGSMYIVLYHLTILVLILYALWYDTKKENCVLDGELNPYPLITNAHPLITNVSDLKISKSRHLAVWSWRFV